MSRNPHATNLRHHKPKRIEDKRGKTTPFVLEDYLDTPEMIAAYAEALAEEDRECPTGHSAT